MRYTLHRYDAVTSTNDLAMRMADEGASEGTAVIAREQGAGRGRRGRCWVSPPDCGVYLSIVLRPRVPSSELWQLAFVAALSLAEAVEHVSCVSSRIKWPNDVLVNGRKIAGILVEARRAARSSESAAVVGLGLNVNSTDFPPELAEIATSMAIEEGKRFALRTVEQEVLDAFRARYEQYVADGFGPILEAWKGLDCTVGRDVEVRTTDHILEGTAVEVTPLGNLVIDCRDGTRREVRAGEVLFAGEI
jgi:BirA family biotin operon repressor/biotin-[acetyl-CoA-carboxylase] ligase